MAAMTSFHEKTLLASSYSIVYFRSCFTTNAQEENVQKNVIFVPQ